MGASEIALPSATYLAPSASLLHQARAKSVSGCVAGDGPSSASGRAISTGYTGARASLGSLFADTTEAVSVPFSGPRAALPQQQQQQQPPQPLRSAPGLAAVEAAARNSGGDTGSAMSASDGTVQCPELPATRNPSASPINSPFPQASAFGASGSAVLPADSHSLPPRQPATPGAQCVPAATAVAVACCEEAAGGGLVSEARADSGAAVAATACEASEERRQSGGGWLTDPKASISNLPPPVRVTVGPNAVRPQQQQQQQPPGLSTAKKRGREAVQLQQQQQQQRWDSEEDSDSEKARAGGGVGRASGGHGARRDPDDADKKTALVGMFLPERYMLGVDCIQVDGTFVSRSRFEKLGGSLMAKWYRSIRVVDTAEPLGTWLQRHGLPVFTGKARQRRQRILPHNVTAKVAAAVAASTRPTTGPTDAVKNQRSSNNSLTGKNDRQAEAAASGAGAVPAPTLTPTPAAAHQRAGSDTDAGVSPGGAAGGGAAAAGAWAGSPAYEADPEQAAASAVMAIGGACGDEGFQGANTDVAAAARHAPGPHTGAWDGPVPCMLEPGQGRGSGPLGPQLPKAEVRRCGPALPPRPSAPGIDAGGAPCAPEVAAAAGAASRAAAGAIGGGGSGAGAARGSGGGAAGARPSCLSLETLPNGAVAPGVYLIGGRMGLIERCAPPEGQQKLPDQPGQGQLQRSLSSQQQQPLPTQQQLPLEQQQQQRVAGLPVGDGWRSATDNGAASFSATGATSQAAAAFGSPPPPSGVPSGLDAGRDVAGWGPTLSAGGRLAAAVGVESPSSPFSFRRLGSDGAAGLAAGSQPQLSACASASRPPLEAAQKAAHAASVTAPETFGGYGGGGGAFAAAPGPASSCRLAEASSLESVPTTAASGWVSSGYPVPNPAAAGLAPYGSYDPIVRRDWEAEACPPPYGVLPTSASAPVQAPRYMHDPEQQHQQQHPAASQRLAHESLLRGLSPSLWPPPRAKPPPLAVPARSSFTNTSYQQLPCQGEEEQSSLADGGGQSVASAGAASDPSLPRPAAAAAAAAREAALPPAAQGSGAGAGAAHLPLTPQKSMHLYPPGGRHWPYGPQYAPYNPYGAHVRGSAPGAPTRHPVGAACGVRPYYRNVYPREMPPGGGMPPPLPPPSLHSPYVYYYGHPYHRRAPAVPPYRRCYAVSAPGTVEAPPPLGSYGARYDPNAVYGPYAPARPDLEAPLDVAEPEVGLASYPAAAGMSSGDVDPTTSPPARMGHPVGTHVPAAAVAAAAPPVPAAATVAALPSRTSGGGCGGVVLPGSALPGITTPGNALLPMVQQQRLQQGAPAGPPYYSSWGGAPPPQGFWHLSANGHPPQSTIEGGVDLGLGADDGVGAVPGNWRPEATGPASNMGPASAGASPLSAPSTGASMGLGRPAVAAAAAAADGPMGTLRPQAAAAGAGGEADIDPMWASFQRWSAYEGARASQ